MYNSIIVKGAREHNLKNIDIAIPKNSLTVITGLSGSGKSTLAFDTIYAEGQRRYVESLSAYARQFLGVMQKPDVDSIEGLSPAIAIEQKTVSKNPRSTVGTVTEIYDYLRLLFARIGVAHCPICQKKIVPQTTEMIVSHVQELASNSKIQIIAPVIRDMKGTHERVFEEYLKHGFTKGYVNGELISLDTAPQLERYKKHTISILIDRLVVSSDKEFVTRLTDAIETATKFATDLVIIKTETEEFLFNRKGGCNEHPHIQCEELQPRMFSFNSPFGACPDCHGLGLKFEFNKELIVDHDVSLADNCVKVFSGTVDGWRKNQLLAVAKYYGIDIFAPFKALKKEQQDLLLYGDKNPQVLGRKTYGEGYWGKDAFEGIIPLLERLYKNIEGDTRRERYEQYMTEKQCLSCNGNRLKPQSLSVTVHRKNIVDVTHLSIQDALIFFSTLQLTKNEQIIAKQILKEIIQRLTFLKNVGLSYLSLDRSAGTLSGGEGQRIRLATQIGSNLTGVLYVLDEPSIGLHQRDNQKLIRALLELRDLGNTVLVVEHDEDTMRASDYLIDMGPGAGIHGGTVIYAGSPKGIDKSKSITGQYLCGKKAISIPKKRRSFSKKITIVDAQQHNLRHVTVDIPLGVFCAISGVSGSGKSTLINHTLKPVLHNHFYGTTLPCGAHKSMKGIEYVDKIIGIDQSPIGRTPRSNPATYINLFTPIRELFSLTKEAKSRGYGPGRFSFNVEGGRCEACQGDGVIKIEMNFLPDVYVTCEQCKGKRYNSETLQILYKDKSISDILGMSVEEAFAFFENIPSIASKLEVLNDVGLGYIKLGQSATTLSGGEAQRIKLTAELSKRATGNTLYILDEPTTGLHFEDVAKLLDMLNRLVDKGNSVVIIEHNLDVIKCADYVIDLGPEGGSGGGQIIAQGTPEQVAQVRESFTGQFLKQLLKD